MNLTNVVVTTSILTTMLLTGCSTKDNQYLLFQDKPETIKTVMDSRDAMPVGTYESKVIPNNRLSVLVFNHPELSTRDVRAQVDPKQERGALVAQDGTVNLPLIGVIRVAGLTSREVANLLTREYSRYIKHSHVTVDILNKRIFVMGEVRNPGRVDIVEDTTNLLEALSATGDLTEFAARNKIKIIRGTRNKPEVETIDLTRLNALALNRLTLYPNDVVYVEPNESKLRNIGIAEALPGVDIASRILTMLFTGKQLTNTHIFNVNSFAPYQY
jgi:polysaccharide export outer membrane protein